MDITQFAAQAMAALSRGLKRTLFGENGGRGGADAAKPLRANIALRDSAAFALSNFWARYNDGWSLVLFRDASGAVRHVACEDADGEYVDLCGRCSAEQISRRLGLELTPTHGDEADVQPLLGKIPAVLEAADELRQRVDQEAELREAQTPTV